MRQAAGIRSIAPILGAVLGFAGTPALAQTASTQQQLDELKRLIEQQQQVIQDLQRRVEELQEQAVETKEAVSTAREQADQARREVAEKPLITSGQPKVKLAISGHVNRAINFVGDGDNTKALFVDNDNSASRVRLIGTGQISDDLTLGTRIELGIAPNSTSNVSQDREDAGDKLDQRIVEASLTSKSLGTVYLGKGPTASDGVSQVDLSGTDVLAYSAIADIAGALKFRDEDDDNLTDITIANAFTDYDGPRRDRLRYDTPNIAGFILGGTAISNQRYDGALRWGGQGQGLKAAAAAGMQWVNIKDIDLRYSGSFSVLHEASGLNLTASAGSDKRDDRDDPYNLYVKGGWLQSFLEVGSTAMSIDYTYSRNRPAEDDKGMSVGAALVQQLAAYGTELYAGVRWYTLDTDSGPDLNDIWLGTVGTRVRF